MVRFEGGNLKESGLKGKKRRTMNAKNPGDGKETKRGKEIKAAERNQGS